MPAEYDFAEIMDFKSISFLIAGCEGFSYEEKQKFLEMTSTDKRLEKSVEALDKIIESMKITLEIQKIIGGNGIWHDSPAYRREATSKKALDT